MKSELWLFCEGRIYNDACQRMLRVVSDDLKGWTTTPNLALATCPSCRKKVAKDFSPVVGDERKSPFAVRRVRVPSSRRR